METKKEYKPDSDGIIRPMRAELVFPKTGDKVAVLEEIHNLETPMCCRCCEVNCCSGGCFLCNAWMNPHKCKACSFHGCCHKTCGSILPCCRMCDTDTCVERCDCYAAGDIADEAAYLERQEMHDGFCAFHLSKPFNYSSRYHRVVHENGIEVSYAFPVPGKGVVDVKNMFYFDQLYYDKINLSAFQGEFGCCCKPSGIILNNRPLHARHYPCCYTDVYPADIVGIPNVANVKEIHQLVVDARRKRMQTMQ